MPIDLSRYIKKAVRDIYNRKVNVKKDVDVDLFEGIKSVFDTAVDKSFRSGDGFAGQLKTNNEVYSVFRTHRMQNDIAAQLTGEDGKLKSFRTFKKDVAPIASHHVDRWLQTEYDTAVIRAHQAANWQQYEKDKDIMPNLRWLPSTSSNPSPDHRVFWGTVRPVDDPFWSMHRPGDRWNCKCDLEATDDDVTQKPEGTPNDNPSPGLKNNPGKDARLFNDDGPFFPQSCASCPFSGKQSALTLSKKKKDCYNCQAAREAAKSAKKTMPETWSVVPTKSGKVKISSRHGSNEKSENIRIASFFANKYSHDIELLSRSDTEKTADAYNNTLGFIQEYKTNNTNSKNAIDKAIKDAARKSDNIVLEIKSNINVVDLAAALKDRVARKPNIQSVWIIHDKFDRQYTRDEILSNDFKIQWD